MTDEPTFRVLVTGATGVVGRVVQRHLADRFRLTYLTRHAADVASHIGDISDLPAIQPAFERANAVVHLAGASSVDAPWSDVLSANIVGTYNVFEASRRAGVRRIVLASSNHTIGMYEADGAPAIYALDDGRTYDASVPVRPDSLYGASKVFGEALGRLYHDRYGLEVICLRIGGVRDDDDPTAVGAGQPFSPLPELTAEEARSRWRSVWLSQRDCAQLIERALTAPVDWAVVYGTSNNPRRMWDLDGARDILGFEPQDAAPT